jgi:hypothetical protein
MEVMLVTIMSSGRVVENTILAGIAAFGALYYCCTSEWAFERTPRCSSSIADVYRFACQSRLRSYAKQESERRAARGVREEPSS